MNRVPAQQPMSAQCCMLALAPLRVCAIIVSGQNKSREAGISRRNAGSSLNFVFMNCLYLTTLLMEVK